MNVSIQKENPIGQLPFLIINEITSPKRKSKFLKFGGEKQKDIIPN
jgi:hypothetical protein